MCVCCQVLFESCLLDIFNNNLDPPSDFKELRAEIGSQLARENLQITELLINKLVQLYVSKGIRLGNMLVGPTCSGKSTCWRILAQALTSLASRDAKDNPNTANRELKDGAGAGGSLRRRYDAVVIDVLNPKAYETDELYGNHDRNTKEWCPGIMATILKHFCEDSKSNSPAPGSAAAASSAAAAAAAGSAGAAAVSAAAAAAAQSSTDKWLVLDGPVDTEWVESLNSVLDDSKVLTLLNADRIPFPKEVSLLFEVSDLAAASPATVSRCGMVFLDRSTINWRNYVYTWLAAKAAESELKIDEREAALKHLPIPIWTKEGVETLGKLFDGYAAPVLHFKTTDYETKEPIPIAEFNAIQSLCRLFDAVATYENGIDPKGKLPPHCPCFDLPARAELDLCFAV
jgi:dynein heavy chain